MRRPIVPPMADIISKNLAALSLVILSKYVTCSIRIRKNLNCDFTSSKMYILVYVFRRISLDKDTWTNIAALWQYCESIMSAKALPRLE